MQLSFQSIMTTIQGDVVMQGFVNSRDTEDQFLTTGREVSDVNSVKGLLKMEDKK
jgi:osmotically-inducible protein OsmY